jgi:hypothetical protein
MIRNHLINDPEASPSSPVHSKGTYPAYRVQSSDDPWFTSSSSSVNNSPTSSEGKGDGAILSILSILPSYLLI